MKILSPILICVLLLIAGCGAAVSNKSGVEVIIDGQGEFPKALAGIWKADRDGWEIVFEPDGRISSAVITLGKMRITPEHSTTVPMKMDRRSVLEPGLWTVQYTPENRELAVEIVVEKFHLEMGTGVLEGNSKDLFIGTVSEDGREWVAEWLSYPEYFVTAGKYKNHKLAVDHDTEADKGTVIFTRIENPN